MMVTHEYDVAQHAKRIIRMQDGRIRSDRTTQQDNIEEKKAGEKTEDAG